MEIEKKKEYERAEIEIIGFTSDDVMLDSNETRPIIDD